jgi:RNA-directed DNA polymerase
MKRHNNLLHQIADIRNLELAFWKARKGKNGYPTVEKYRDHLSNHLTALSDNIINGNVKLSDYRFFKIFDPKERDICAAFFSDRVLHHALMNVCHPFFEKYQIFDSYASRIGKGTYAAIDRAASFQKRFRYFLKLDVRKHFETIDHQVMKNMLSRQFKEEKLLCIFDTIINSYSTQPGKGLPIGNLTSQYFANHYLAVSDHYIKEQLRVKAYVRYMDDMVLWSENKNELLHAGKQLDAYMTEELKLQLKPFCLNTSNRGLPYLGYLIGKNHIHLNQRSRHRLRVKMLTYESLRIDGVWQEGEYHRRITPLLAFAEKADSRKLREKIIHDIEKKDTNHERLPSCDAWRQLEQLG